MNIVFRADASVELGTGHFMRCLTLADALQEASAAVRFFCHRLPDALPPLLHARGFSLTIIPEATGWESDAQVCSSTIVALGHRIDWLIVDHYALDAHWEQRFRSHAERILVIDDLANRLHDCDVLLDQSWLGTSNPYANLVPKECRVYLGPRYALIRNEILKASMPSRPRSGQIKRILVFMGGTDPHNATQKVLEGLTPLASDIEIIDVVVGSGNPHRDAIAQQCRIIPAARYHLQPHDMAGLTRQADLALGAAGTASWERCLLGVPTIVLVLADNQAEVARRLDAHGAAVNLGRVGSLSAAMITRTVRQLMENPDKVLHMGSKARDIIGGTAFEGAAAIARALKESHARS